MADPTAILLILAVSAFTPPLLFLSWVRKTERFGREPMGRVLRTFFWGAIFAVLIAIVLQTLGILLFQEADRVYAISQRLRTPADLVLALVVALLVAPFTEEFAKGFGVYLAGPIVDEPEDGLVYGAASGLGFSASENLLYGFTFLVLYGSFASLVVIAIRSISSVFLHASASATYGYGIALNRLWPHRFRPLPYYLLAVGMHGVYNFFAALADLGRSQYGDTAALIGLGGAILIGIVAFVALRAKIRAVDAQRVTW